MNVLSIQSHVAYGHVGNAAAVFALQCLGHEVWPIHTVLFSNHPGHGAHRGRIVPPNEVADVVDGLDELGVLGSCDAVLSGYLGDAGTADAVVDAVRRVKSTNPGALFLCDPVMGDREGGLYVAAEIVGALRDHAVPLADIVSPNVFELETLTGRRVTDIHSLLDAMEALRARGPRTVVVTGFADGAGSILSFVSDPSGTARVGSPAIAAATRPDGAGDLLCALFLGRLLDGRQPRDALADAVAAVHGVLEATVKAGSRELELIAAREEMVRPSRRFAPTTVGATF